MGDELNARKTDVIARRANECLRRGAQTCRTAGMGQNVALLQKGVLSLQDPVSTGMKGGDARGKEPRCAPPLLVVWVVRLAVAHSRQ